MELFDTHCHIHEILGSDDLAAKWHKDEVRDADKVIAEAHEAGVNRLMVVGCTVEDSALAVDFVQGRDHCWASIGIHPHEAKEYVNDKARLIDFATLATHRKVHAIGECGLDYFYTHSPKADQARILRFQIELALAHDLPMIFHVRDAFDDFWPIFDEYSGIRGVIHSFSAGEHELDQVLARNLYVGLNGIMTFTKDDTQLQAAKKVPLSRLVLETDAPFLTPKPFRGKINYPKHVVETAKFLAVLRQETLDDLALASTKNARALFGV